METPNIVGNAVDRLNTFTTSFDAYDEDIQQLKRKIVQAEKSREKTEKKILEQNIAGRETCRMNNIIQQRPKRLQLPQSELFALHKKDLNRLRRFSKNKLNVN